MFVDHATAESRIRSIKVHCDESPNKGAVLILDGPVASGKTHLLHAVGNQLLHTNIRLDVGFDTGHGFANELRGAASHEELIEIRHRRRKLEVWLIDNGERLDFDSVAGVEVLRAAELIVEGRGLVCIAVRGLEAAKLVTAEFKRRKVSPVERVSLDAPDYGRRLIIVLRKLAAAGFNATREAAAELLRLVDQRLHDVDNIVESIANEHGGSGFAERRGRIELDRGHIRAMAPKLSRSSRVPTAARVVEAVSATTGVSPASMRSVRRSAVVVRARLVAICVCSRTNCASLRSLARALNKHHGVIARRCAVAEVVFQRDTQFRSDIEAVMRALGIPRIGATDAAF
jgi:chromosomal replication initiator protein